MSALILLLLGGAGPPSAPVVHGTAQIALNVGRGLPASSGMNNPSTTCLDATVFDLQPPAPTKDRHALIVRYHWSVYRVWYRPLYSVPFCRPPTATYMAAIDPMVATGQSGAWLVLTLQAPGYWRTGLQCSVLVMDANNHRLIWRGYAHTRP